MGIPASVELTKLQNGKLSSMETHLPDYWCNADFPTAIPPTLLEMVTVAPSHRLIVRASEHPCIPSSLPDPGSLSAATD